MRRVWMMRMKMVWQRRKGWVLCDYSFMDTHTHE